MKQQRGLAEKLTPKIDDRTATSELGKKWRLLQAAAGGRSWSSLDETRHCVLCERTFSGREVGLERNPRGLQLRCPTPGCPSTPAQWIHPGNPLISEEAWRDWVRLLDSLCDEPPRPRGKKPKNRLGLKPIRNSRTQEKTERIRKPGNQE